MVHRPSRKLRLPAFMLALAAFPVTAIPVAAQEPPRINEAQFDPSDVFFQGYLAARSAERLEADGDFVGAHEKLEQARKLFETVAKFHPEWKGSMVTGRMTKTGEAIEKVRPRADEQRAKQAGIIAELEGGVKMPATPDPEPLPSAPGVLDADPIASRRLAEAEAEVQRLRNLLNAPGNEAARDASRVGDLTRQRDALAAQLRAAQTLAQGLRAKLAAEPVQGELRALNKRIAGLEQEREAMARALAQSRGAQAEAETRQGTLETELKSLRQQVADLTRDIGVERNVANEVVAGQRRQLQLLEKALETKTTELAKANERIASLTLELGQSRAAFTELKAEADTLLQEKVQMSALLKLNEAGRINELVEQNMGLAKQLREAKEKVDSVNSNNLAAQDEINDALRDLAMAKSKINELHREKREQTRRINELEAKLRREEDALAKGEAGANAAETEVLRDIIRRQLRTQERRRQARELLVEAVKQMGSQDERVASAIQLFDGEEIALSPDEQKLIADKQVDGEFVSPFARDRETVDRATSDLNRQIEGYDRAATKAFASQRYLSTRELFQIIVEENPGNISALCKLGVVHLRLNDASAATDAFRRAVELDENNPYAHRMLGFAAMTEGDLAAAEHNVRRSIDLSPDDAKNHILLANICYRQGRLADAENHYKAAISADPIPSEPYFNLALLCVRGKRFDAARTYYYQALERGALPDPSLEKRFNSR